MKRKNKLMNEMNEKKIFIKEYISENECNYMCDDTVFNCESCSCFEDCYLESCIRCDEELANDVNYSGYNTEEEFWEQI